MSDLIMFRWKILQVISGLDLFSQVGANTPLVIADIRMLVGLEGELAIRFEGVTGTAILCGISIRKEETATCMFQDFFFWFLQLPCVIYGYIWCLEIREVFNLFNQTSIFLFQMLKTPEC